MNRAATAAAARAVRTRVIVNADDYGLTDGVNRGIEEAHLGGIVTSTTALANGEAVAAAAGLARRCPEMSVGVHVNLTLGAPIADAGRVASLVGSDGRFHPRSELIKLALRRKVAAQEVALEATAQIRVLQDLGIAPTHWDTHLHVAEMPQLALPIARAARDAGIRRARTPRLWITNTASHPLVARWRWRTASPARLGGEAARAISQRILARSFRLPDYRFAANGVDAPGVSYAQRWELAFGHLPSGTCEIPIHPAHLDDRLRELTPNLTDERVVDLEVATSAHIRALLDDRGAQLIPFTRLGG